jgi:hypothetical protein
MPLGWLMWIRLAAGYLPRRSSETQPEKSCDHNDHDHHADNVKNIHCFAPIEAALALVQQRRCAFVPTN